MSVVDQPRFHISRVDEYCVVLKISTSSSELCEPLLAGLHIKIPRWGASYGIPGVNDLEFEVCLRSVGENMLDGLQEIVRAVWFCDIIMRLKSCTLDCICKSRRSSQHNHLVS